MRNFDPTTPVILLGGRTNALAVARNLGRLGVHVTASGRHGARAMNSKYCKQAYLVPKGEDAATYWHALLLEDKVDQLKRRIVIPCCDESLFFVQDNYEALSEHYILEELVPEQRRTMLDKQATLVAAKEVNVPIPTYWHIDSVDDVKNIRNEIRYPVMVKPRDSEAFSNKFGQKLFIVKENFDEVVEKVELSISSGHAVMVVEMIPGPDNLLSSYYTYRTEEGVRLYDYTKSVIRRYPVNRGGTTFHQSEWLPETAAMGQRLFDGIDWNGIGNVEFKLDTRDNLLKIIEVNARFTAAHRLITEAGAPIDIIIYCHLTGQPGPTFTAYSNELRMLSPRRDFAAYFELRGLKHITTIGWVKSLFEQKVVLGYFSWSDPGPLFMEFFSNITRALSKIKRRLTEA